jgi:hypothetical protein
MGTSQPKMTQARTRGECLSLEPQRGWPLLEDLVIRAQKPFRFSELGSLDNDNTGKSKTRGGDLGTNEHL